jgi:hypothetical protein
LKSVLAFLKVTKNGDARAVPLSGRAIEVLQSIPRASGNRVLLVEKQGLHSVFKTACKRAKIEDFTWHDLTTRINFKICGTWRLFDS